MGGKDGWGVKAAEVQGEIQRGKETQSSMENRKYLTSDTTQPPPPPLG